MESIEFWPRWQQGRDTLGKAVEPDVADFEDVGSCKSELYMYILYCTEEPEENWYRNALCVLEWPEDDGGVAEYAEPPVKIFGRIHDLAALPDQESVKTTAAAFRLETEKALGVSLGCAA
ncbi:MAG: hypothetical protein AB7E29_06105 [Xanthobacter sp.]